MAAVWPCHSVQPSHLDSSSCDCSTTQRATGQGRAPFWAPTSSHTSQCLGCMIRVCATRSRLWGRASQAGHTGGAHRRPHHPQRHSASARLEQTHQGMGKGISCASTTRHRTTEYQMWSQKHLSCRGQSGPATAASHAGTRGVFSTAKRRVPPGPSATHKCAVSARWVPGGTLLLAVLLHAVLAELAGAARRAV